MSSLSKNCLVLCLERSSSSFFFSKNLEFLHFRFLLISFTSIHVRRLLTLKFMSIRGMIEFFSLIRYRNSPWSNIIVYKSCYLFFLLPGKAKPVSNKTCSFHVNKRLHHDTEVSYFLNVSNLYRADDQCKWPCLKI